MPIPIWVLDGRWSSFQTKKFNFDGPDGLNYYWHDLRKAKVRFNKRQGGGGGIMLWGAVEIRGLVRVNGRGLKNVLGGS
jgi:hypothetical protein